MSARDILNNLDAAIALRWPNTEDCPKLAEIAWLGDEITKTKKSLKQLKKNKQETASQFKNAKEQPDRLAELKKAMQAVSAQLGEAEAYRKKMETELLDIFAQAEDRQQQEPFPLRFSNKPTKDAAPPENLEFSIDVSANDWDKYVSNHPSASAYHAYAWKTVVEKSFNHNCIYLAAIHSGSIIGLLPLIAFKHPVFGCFAVSVPYFNYGGPLADSPKIALALIEYAKKLKASFDWTHVEIRTCDKHYPLPREARKASMILALPDSMQTLESRLGAKVRAQYKLTEKAQPSIHFGGLELLNDYYKIFAHNMRDLGTPVYSRAFFKNILEQFPNQATIVVARIKNKPMATAFLFGHEDMLEIPWASTLKKANQFNLNMWMYKNILQFAIGEGYSYFDFGRSTVDAGTYKFKKQWGAQPLKHYWYYILDDGAELPKINPDNPKYKLAISVWKKLPVCITKIIGPTLVKNIP